MSIRIGAVLILLAQSLPLAGPGAFLVCVHENGEVQYELAAKPCCEDAGSAVRSAHSERSDAEQIGGAPGRDHCRDYSATFLQASPSGGDSKCAPAYEVTSSLADPIMACVPAIPAIPVLSPGNSAGPPMKRAPLSLLKTVVLQV